MYAVSVVFEQLDLMNVNRPSRFGVRRNGSSMYVHSISLMYSEGCIFCIEPPFDLWRLCIDFRQRQKAAHNDEGCDCFFHFIVFLVLKTVNRVRSYKLRTMG